MSRTGFCNGKCTGETGLVKHTPSGAHGRPGAFGDRGMLVSSTTLNLRDEAIERRREGGWEESFAIPSCVPLFFAVFRMRNPRVWCMPLDFLALYYDMN